jgi:iron-sulfur cluster insertion protein
MNITDAAFDRIERLVNEENIESRCLRIYVRGGGCSGFQYGFQFEEEGPAEDDLIIERNGVKAVIDPMSSMYLSEATLDYKTGLEGDMFAINNPSATTTCGCGSSFGV